MKKALQLALWILAIQLIGFAMGMITNTQLDPWYGSLQRSSLTPPGYVFGIAWTILYFMLSVAGWYLFHFDKPTATKTIKRIFIAQLVLNFLWTPLFFYCHWIGAALLCLLTITGLTFALLCLTWRRSKPVFGLLLPYWVWLSFASYLNFYIWYMRI